MIGTTFKIGNQEYKVERVQDMDESLINSRKRMIESNKEPRVYFASKVLKSGKQSKQGGMFYRFNSGRFIKVI